MKKILSLLIAGVVVAASTLQAENLNVVSSEKISTNGTIDSGIDLLSNDDVDLSRHKGRAAGQRSRPRTFGYATLPVSVLTQFPACGKVHFTQLPVSTNNVILSDGCLELPRGVYRLAYGLNLQNSGGADLIQMWLTIKTRKTQDISDSIVQANISPSNQSGTTFFVVDGEMLLRVDRTSQICLNYSTRGTSTLSSVPPPPVTSLDQPPVKTPLPFYLFAIKVGDIKT